MKKIKYRVKYIAEGLTKSEMRDMKISQILNESVVEFECENEPRIPKNNIMIGGKKFQIGDITEEYIKENGVIIHEIRVEIESTTKIEAKMNLDLLGGINNRFKIK